MSVDTRREPALTESGEDDADHLACPCSPEIAACGAPLDPDQFEDEGWYPGENCVLCELVADELCPRCGA